MCVLSKGKLAEIHGPVPEKWASYRPVHWRLHLRATHCWLDYGSFITAGPCAFRLWHMYSTLPDSHTHLNIYIYTAFRASRRSVGNSLVLLMSRAQSKQGHLCRTSQDKEKSQLKKYCENIFQFFISASEVTDCWTTACNANYYSRTNWFSE